MKKALVILFDKVEELEAIAPVDILRRARVDVTTAALGDTLEIIGRSGIAIDADEPFEDARKKNFDAVILPGGPGVCDILDMHPDDIAPMRGLFERHLNGGKIVAAICAAPMVLAEMEILKGKKCTAHQSVADKIENADVSKNVVRDGGVITSRGAGTAVEFGLEILAALEGESVADKVAQSICFSK